MMVCETFLTRTKSTICWSNIVLSRCFCWTLSKTISSTVIIMIIIIILIIIIIMIDTFRIIPILHSRRVFNSFTYFMLLYNVATGLYTSIMRVLVAILLTLLVKPRLDRIVFIAPFQRFDTGDMMKTVDV